MDESIYCFNCDTEALYYVDWKWADKIRRTYMCQTCRDAFGFGQCVSEQHVHSIEEEVKTS